MDTTKIVFATDNGKTYIDRHFGDAEHYDIYEISSTEAKFVKKAKGITGLFKDDDVRVVVSKVFGPNIKRIRKNFVCILMNDEMISESITKIQNNITAIKEEWEKGENRKHLNYKTLA